MITGHVINSTARLEFYGMKKNSLERKVQKVISAGRGEGIGIRTSCALET